jgi:hypothetical protein
MGEVGAEVMLAGCKVKVEIHEFFSKSPLSPLILDET